MIETVSSSEPGAGRGRLAQVIAARGGQAAPEAPFVIEHREALLYMLCQAAELEHGIMCQYLFAAFSLKQHADEGLTEAELTAVTRWRRQISHVATQEMLHLALVQNLMSAIGGAPHLARPNLPNPAGHYPAGVTLALLPFGEQALRHFMFLERPEGMALDDAEGLAAVGRAAPLTAPGDIVPRLQDFATVGHLYRSIEEGFARLAAKLGERSLFIGPPRAQATSATFRWPELVAVTDLATACRAIEEILEQGEGPRGDWRDAHFGQFVAILDEFHQLTAANPAFDPVRPVLVANVRPCEHASDVLLITDPVTARCADLFNVSYEILLLALERYFAHTEETDAQLATLTDLTMGLMFQAIKPLGDLLTTLPAGPDYPGRTAGPSFELFYESDYLIPHREAAWCMLAERLVEAAEFCERIRADAGGPVADALDPIGSALVELAGSLAVGKTGPGRADQGVTSTQTVEWQPLLDRAAELSWQTPGAVLTEETAQGIAEVFAGGQEVLRAMATDASSDRFGPVAARLVDSVLRPLACALGHNCAGDAAERPSTTGSGPVAERLWLLATTATRLRAAGSSAPLELLEATAALQDLALELDPPDQRDERLAELREIQAALPTGIQSAPDGPYLVTNAETLTNHLGETIPTLPQMALCRCGGSTIKPFCDGSHARLGFSGAKDPKRVPDRRDSYDGVQVTVLDNRGICAHSGFCTDRLNTVFHLGAEPFVTPSGGRMDEIINRVRDCPSGALSYAIDGREAREQVDQATREPGIEVSKDGPYRVTGGIPLTDPDGNPEPRAVGASTEHYSLCRCGQSQNKPFCSGMHWYVNFADPVPGPDATPTLFEWAGGFPALLRTTRLFYSKHVPADPLLSPLFAEMSADQPDRVAAWLGEVFGGPSYYNDRYDGDPRMLSQHVGNCLTEAQRARWVALLSQSAEEAGLPADAEFRSAFVSYLEWGSRLAVENSQTDSRPPQHPLTPRWDWGTAGPPGQRISAPATATAAEPEPELPAADEPVSFERHIKALFRARDRQSMRFVFDLWSYDDVTAHAADILKRVRSGSMPCDQTWPPKKVAVFARWVEIGTPQ